MKLKHYTKYIVTLLSIACSPSYNLQSIDDEVIAIVIRDSEGFEENAQDGVVNWLDERRPMLQEFDPVNRHTIPMTGDLIE